MFVEVGRDAVIQRDTVIQSNAVIQNYIEEKLEFLSSLPVFPLREPKGHKGTYGLAVLVGGSRGMAGSISLAGKSALIAGSGLVRLLVPDPILETTASFMPEYMTVPLPADPCGRLAFNSLEIVNTQVEKAAVVGLGPGLGQSEFLTGFVEELFLHLGKPLVLDADALNLLSQNDFLGGRVVSGTRKQVLSDPNILRIFTPHPGEFSRLTGRKPSGDDSERREMALDFARRYREKYTGSLILVLKGHHTVITDGISVYCNETGNPGMGTGGSGDVLTGLITGLLAQKLLPITAVRLAVALHGMAGDFAAMTMPMECLTASDLIRFFPGALYELRRFQGEKAVVQGSGEV